MNERKTEAIVRNHFNRFLSEIEIEEKISDSPKIDKLLKSASKKGGGKGYPEFIITFKKFPDLFIVIECKANITKHESQFGDKYTEFAVDGVLLYASYLSKEFDVLAIAVSGENKNEIKVSHFLQLASERTAAEMFSGKLLNIKSYISGYIESPQKLNQDYQKLSAFSKKLNKELHRHKISKDKRCILISGI